MLPNFGETGISNDSDEEDEEVVKRFTWHDIPCPLCLNPTKYPTALKCGHCLCWECAWSVVNRNQSARCVARLVNPQELITIANP